MNDKWNNPSKSYKFEVNTTRGGIHIPCHGCGEGIAPGQGMFICNKTKHTFCCVDHLEQNLDTLARIAAQAKFYLDTLARIAAQAKFYVVLIEDESMPAEVKLFSKDVDAVNYANMWAKTRAEDRGYISTYFNSELAHGCICIYGLNYDPECGRVSVWEKVVDSELINLRGKSDGRS